MCGRYSLSKRQAEVEERFGIKQILLNFGFEPRYNIAPSQEVPVIIEGSEGRILKAMKWGLIPFWVKDSRKMKPFINARAETIAEKPSFKQNLAKRRCIIPACGFYEWRKDGKAKIPYHIHRSDFETLGFAGLWDRWTSPEGEVVETCTIITTSANTLIAPVHERMPVILQGLEAESNWLNPVAAPERLLELLVSYPGEKMSMHEVSGLVNSPSVDAPELLAAAAR